MDCSRWGDRLPRVLLAVVECLGRPAGLGAGVLLEAAELVVLGAEHPAVGVVDQDDLLRAEQALGDGEGTDRGSVTTPPAFRITCASPSQRPRIP
jgi:hypothetical protein